MLIFIILIHLAKGFQVPEAQCFNDNHCLAYGPYHRCRAIVYQPTGHWIGVCHNTQPDLDHNMTSSRQMARFRECCTSDDCGLHYDIGCNVDLGCPVDPIKPQPPVNEYWRPWERSLKGTIKKRSIGGDKTMPPILNRQPNSYSQCSRGLAPIASGESSLSSSSEEEESVSSVSCMSKTKRWLKGICIRLNTIGPCRTSRDCPIGFHCFHIKMGVRRCLPNPLWSIIG